MLWGYLIKLSFKDDLDELKIYERKLNNQAVILLVIGIRVNKYKRHWISCMGLHTAA